MDYKLKCVTPKCDHRDVFFPSPSQRCSHCGKPMLLHDIPYNMLVATVNQAEEADSQTRALEGIREALDNLVFHLVETPRL